MALEAPIRTSTGSLSSFTGQPDITATSPESTTSSSKFMPMYVAF